MSLAASIGCSQTMICVGCGRRRPNLSSGTTKHVPGGNAVNHEAPKTGEICLRAKKWTRHLPTTKQSHRDIRCS